MDLVEQIGSGITRIMQLCDENEIAPPDVAVEDNWVTVIFRRRQDDVIHAVSKPTGQVTDDIKSLIQICTGQLSRSELQTKLNLKHRDNFTNNYLNPAIKAGLLEMTIPDKPQSSKQKYQLTPKGKSIL